MVGLFSCSEGNPSQPQSAVADADAAALMRLFFHTIKNVYLYGYQ